MKSRNPLCVFLSISLMLAALLSGCESREDRVRGAFDQYQAAMAAADLPAARKALLMLVAEDDSVAQYWLELGKAQLALADFAGSYDSFVRAHELDRANPEILGILTQLSLRSGDMQRAQEHARQLELVAPGDPAIGLTYGYAALRRDDVAGATEEVTKLLAVAPYDPSAKVLRSRILLHSGKPAEAIAMLQEQIGLQPSDELALRALLAIYERQDQWSDASATARNLLKWQPKDRDLRARLVEAGLRAADLRGALADTMTGLRDADPRQIERLLAPWIATGHEAAAARAVFDVAKATSGERRLALARFLTIAGSPRPALMLTRDMAPLPVKASNLEGNALFATALSQESQGRSGLDRLDTILSLDPGNGDALRGRARALSRAGKHEQAIEDARKLVSTSRRSAQSWLFLARVYDSAGNADAAKRTLWEAFHEIPANHAIYGALRSSILQSDGLAAVTRLSQEFDDQRTAAMARSFM